MWMRQLEIKGIKLHSLSCSTAGLQVQGIHGREIKLWGELQPQVGWDLINILRICNVNTGLLMYEILKMSLFALF